MEILRYSRAEGIPENDYIDENGHEKKANYHWWIDDFLGANPHKSIKDVFLSPKFKIQKKHYDVVALELQSKLNILRVYVDKECVWRSIGMSAEAVEDALSALAENRGGARENAGRKPTGKTKVPLTIQVKPEESEAIRKAAAERGQTISEYVLGKVFAADKV